MPLNSPDSLSFSILTLVGPPPHFLKASLRSCSFTEYARPFKTTAMQPSGFSPGPLFFPLPLPLSLPLPSFPLPLLFPSDGVGFCTLIVLPPYSSPSKARAFLSPASSSKVMKAMPRDRPVSISVSSVKSFIVPHSSKSLLMVSWSRLNGNPPTKTFNALRSAVLPFSASGFVVSSSSRFSSSRDCRSVCFLGSAVSSFFAPTDFFLFFFAGAVTTSATGAGSCRRLEPPPISKLVSS
mmetsp:Transcript_34469/g.92270  ORF Transcript_34469/g.92270 Transcript_34469/m.92270 type:complete len:238 (-) Transcript_34469:333-1046(-)